MPTGKLIPDLSYSCYACGSLHVRDLGVFRFRTCPTCPIKYCSKSCMNWHQRYHAIACKRKITPFALHLFMKRITDYEYGLYYMIRLLVPWGKRGMTIRNFDALNKIDPLRDTSLSGVLLSPGGYLQRVWFLRDEILAAARAQWFHGVHKAPHGFDRRPYFSTIQADIVQSMALPDPDIRAKGYRDFCTSFKRAALHADLRGTYVTELID